MLRLGELVLSGLFVRQMENDFLLGFLKLVMDLFDLFVFSFNSLFSSPETPEKLDGLLLLEPFSMFLGDLRSKMALLMYF